MSDETNSWLSLTDFSIKHKVSVSTLRRRIKSDEIKFKFEDGKYLLLDQELCTHQTDHRPSLKSESNSMSYTINNNTGLDYLKLNSSKYDNGSNPINLKKDEILLQSTNKLLSELKKAYTQVLQEKEQQILELREEIVDLKTLIKVLESENSRLSTIKSTVPC